MRFEVLPSYALDAAERIALERVIRVSDEKACFGEFEVDVHGCVVPTGEDGRAVLGRKSLSARHRRARC